MKPLLQNQISTKRFGANRYAVFFFLTTCFVGFTISSCYRPSFTTTIYKCNGYSCPAGLVCNSDKICVYHPTEGCGNGGIPVDGSTVLCPGASNTCVDGYGACTPDIPELACMRGQAAISDLSTPEPCRICCKK